MCIAAPQLKVMFLYKKTKSDNDEAVVVMDKVKETGNKVTYKLKASQVSDVRAYAVKMDIDPSEYKVLDYNDNFEKQNTYNFYKIIEGNYDLTAKATGILLYLNNRPPNWDFYKSEIVDRFSDGKSSISTGIKELREKGFLTIEKVRGEQGRIKGNKWVLQLPSYNGNLSKNGKSGAGKSNAGKSGTNKTYSSKKYDSETYKTYVEPSSIDSVATNIYLEMFENYTGVPHTGIKPQTLYEVDEKLSEHYNGYGRQKYIEDLTEYFENFSGDGLPKLQHFNEVAPRYFL